jgi:tryptophan 2,3-dioxygenase
LGLAWRRLFGAVRPVEAPLCPMGYGRMAAAAPVPAAAPGTAGPLAPAAPGPAAMAAAPGAGLKPLPGPAGLSDYEKYMRVPELLQLQKPESARVHHDELMFQVVHQSFELWCKLILFELRSIGEMLDKDRIMEAFPLIERCSDAIRLNSESLHVLERMHPWDFHVIRAALGQGSGAESPGFRDIQMQAPRLWPKVEALLRRRKADLMQVYTEPQSHPDLLRLCEHLTDFDMFFHIWRLNHLAMVKRVIGRDVKSLKGYAVHQLEQDVQGVLRPELWKLRNDITLKAGTSPP